LKEVAARRMSSRESVLSMRLQNYAYSG